MNFLLPSCGLVLDLQKLEHSQDPADTLSSVSLPGLDSPEAKCVVLDCVIEGVSQSLPHDCS